MSTVKIILAENETIEAAEENLFKALSSKRSHDPQESWNDPAMLDVQHAMEKAHADMYTSMIADVIDALEEEHVGEYGI